MANMVCVVDGCDKATPRQRLCSMHSTRMLRYGTLDAPRRPSLDERFWAKVDKSGDCWLWTAATVQGYGVIQINRRPVKAHRVAWRLATGEDPGSLCVCHRCDTPPCVRPDHLFLGTGQDNTADKVAKGRQATGPGMVANRDTARGTRNSHAVLTEADVRAIRASTARTQHLAREYGVTSQNIRLIVRRKTWTHID